MGQTSERSTAEDRARAVIGSAPSLSVRDLLARTGVDFVSIQRMCLALGTTVPDWDDPIFTQRDLETLVWVTGLIDDGVLDQATEEALLRGISQSVERLVWWQFEALVDDAATRLDLDDFSARVVVLDRIADFADILERQMVYVWRRHLATMIRWVGNKVDEVDAGRVPVGSLPLTRAVGFVDLVGYTEWSDRLDATGLAALLQDFQATAVDAVTRGGGRVVKAIGDAVMFTTGDPASCALISLDLAAVIGRTAKTPPARVAMAWGGVLERFGDVFGSTVNLAARLGAAAEAGQVVIDDATATALADDDRFVTTRLPRRPLAGLGETTPHRLTQP